MKKSIGAVLSVALLLTGHPMTFAQKGKPLYTAPLGIQTFTFRKSFPNDVAKTLDTIKMMGFTELEGGSNRVPPEEFRKMCEERGITIPSTGAGFEQLMKSP